MLIQIILFRFAANSLLTFSTVVRFILPILLLSASKSFSAFFIYLFFFSFIIVYFAICFPDGQFVS